MSSTLILITANYTRGRSVRLHRLGGVCADTHTGYVQNNRQYKMRLNKNRVIIFALCVMMAFPAFAQRDIKTFDRIGLNAIISILGPHEGEDGMYDDEVLIHYEEGDTYICLNTTTNELLGFNTDSPSFCVLSDYVSGGFKVGDSFEKLRSFDFVHSNYGKNRSGNALTLLESSPERDYYEAFGLERKFFHFCVKNGIITSIIMGTVDDETAEYQNVDMTNSPW